MLEKSKGYSALVDVLGGPQAFLQFKMMESQTYERMAEANARAINGLQPKITSWNTGKHSIFSIPTLTMHNPHVMATGNSESSGDSAPIRNIMQNLPPLWSTIHDQTGIAPPSWIAQMPGQNDQHNNQLAKPNGTNDMSVHA